MKIHKKLSTMLSKALVSYKDLEFTPIDIIGTLFLSTLLVFFFRISDSYWLINILIVPIFLVGYNKSGQLTRLQQKSVQALTMAVLLTYCLRAAFTGYKIVLNPPQWDFYLYWVYGQVGSRFLNPYNPNNLFQYAQALNPGQDLLNELYFFQFPSLIFLFLPLGWFAINKAAFLWTCFLLAVLLLDIILLWSIFCDKEDYKGLLFVGSLTLVLEATFYTLGLTQINFIVLLAFLLYWRRRESVAGGIWLGIGMMVKPILAIALIYPVLRKHWRSLIGVTVSIIASSIITIIAFGPEMFFGYFTKNPIIKQMPNYLYVETVNQSLMATILRLKNFDFNNGSPYLQPAFVITAMLLTGVTAFLIFRANYKNNEGGIYSDYALALTLTLALLIFPKTLMHYAVLLIVPILMTWANHKEAGLNSRVVLIFTTIEYVLVSLGNYCVFISMLLAWLFIAWICVKLLFSRPHEQTSS